MPPAARVGDMHTCPMVTGVVPHVGGPILPPGCPTVLIGNMPAARVGDMATCVGPPDTVAKGSATVMIGNMPAARLGDQTAHGGVIVLGCPTVIIGDSGGGGGGGSGTGAVANTATAASSLKSGSDNPPYEPDRWNQPAVKNSTNCYAYAANDPDGHPPGKPQPGQHCGHPLNDLSCAEVGRAAQCDGMQPAPNPPVTRPGYYPVALVIAPGEDYHWYRQDDNGRWSHKPGNTTARDVDASGNPITNPETANRDYSGSGGPNYSVFCGYYYVPAGGVRTGPP